jgi:hypothetical protein
MLICSDSFYRIRRVVLAIVLSMLLTDGNAGPKYWPAQRGQVLDAETGEPLAGVFVIARYWGYYPVPGHSSSSCYYAAGTTTNEKGEYSIPSHSDFMDIKVDKRSRLNFFKPDYRHVFYKDGIAKLEKDKSSREERLEELTRIARNSSCDGAGQSQQSLFLFHKAIYNEAKAISVAVKEKEQLDWFRWVAASQIIAQDGDQGMSSAEFNRKIDEYLKDHLQ